MRHAAAAPPVPRVEPVRRGLQGGGFSKAINEGDAPVLTLTENASTVVKTLVEQQEAPVGGLRISQDAPDSPALHVIPTQEPQPGDQVVEDGGAKVFLEETAAQTLDDKILDAQVDQNGGVQFTIAPQA
jgi:Fe-S cluster assembly iron-binding protein IscA